MEMTAMVDIDRSMILTEMELVEEYAETSGKIVVHLRADGPIQNPEKADEVWAFYENICDDNIRHLLMQLGEVYCRFESADQARDCIERWFPTKKLLDDEEYDLGPEYYIYAYGVTPEKLGLLHN